MIMRLLSQLIWQSLLITLIAIIIAAIATRLVYPVFFTKLVKLTYDKANSIKNRVYPPKYVSKLRSVIPNAIYCFFKTHRAEKTAEEINKTSAFKNSYNHPLNENTLNVTTNPVKESTSNPLHTPNSSTGEADVSTKNEPNRHLPVILAGEGSGVRCQLPTKGT